MKVLHDHVPGEVVPGRGLYREAGESDVELPADMTRSRFYGWAFSRRRWVPLVGPCPTLAQARDRLAARCRELGLSYPHPSVVLTSGPDSPAAPPGQ